MSTSLRIRIDHKSFASPGSGDSRPILAHLDIQLGEREFVAVIGPSGCGKTTLLNIVAGLDDDFLGEIHWPASETAEPKLGYVFQEPRLLPWLSVRENIALVLDDPGKQGRQIDELLETSGLSSFADFKPRQLSVGMQRRAALVRAFVIQPSLLLMDEPFVSLDQPTAGQLRKLLLDVWSARPTRVLFVTHDLEEATRLADRILFLSTSPASVIAEEIVALTRKEREDPAALKACLEQMRTRFTHLYPGV